FRDAQTLTDLPNGKLQGSLPGCWVTRLAGDLAGRGLLCSQVPEDFEGFVQMGLIVLPHQVEDLAENRIAEGIKDLVAVLAPDDNLLAAQDGQVLRGIGLFQVEAFVNAADGHLVLIAQQLNDGDAGRVGQCLEQLGLETTKGILHAASPWMALSTGRTT